VRGVLTAYRLAGQSESDEVAAQDQSDEEEDGSRAEEGDGGQPEV
jgi:hypothetical protein